MKVLVAEHDAMTRWLLEASLAKWGHTVLSASDGSEAWRILDRDDAPALAILDRMLPGMDGLRVCGRVRQRESPSPPYLVLLVGKGRSEDIVAAFQAGADDYVLTPVDRTELWARIQAGARTVALRQVLAERTRALAARPTRSGEEACASCQRLDVATRARLVARSA
jgi:DNA-binding response OmpR family regulator